MWRKEAVTDGEIDALRRVALAACNDDTRYPAWRGSARDARGHCYCISRWLVHRLGGAIGADHGHYVWLSPGDNYFIDLTGGHGHAARYEPNHTYRRTATVDNERTERFSKRADRIFDSLDTLLRLSLDYAGDSHPAEEPQAADDSERFNDSWTDPEQYWHDEPDPTTPEGVYQFVYGAGQLEISPNHSHEELAGHAGIVPAQHTGPFASGHVVVSSGRATWEVSANVNLHALFRILKDATKDYGWTWGGMTDAQGQPIIEQFAPKKSARTLQYVFGDGHLLLGRTSAADLVASSGRDMGDTAIQGTIAILGERAVVSHVHVDALPSLFEFAEDHGLTLYAGNDNVIKTIPDLQEKDVYNPETTESPNPHEPPAVDERLPSGLYRCPACDQLFPNWHEYQKHRRDQESWGDSDRSNNGDRGLPEPDHGIYGDGAHYHEMRQEPGITTGSVRALDPRDPAPQCSNCGGTTWTHASHQAGREGIDDYYCANCDKPLYGWRTPEESLSPHPDPLMDNEPGSLRLPQNWSKVVVLPARTWKEAARVDGFAKYAEAFKYDNDDYLFYVAYRRGDPLGYCAVGHDGNVQMMHSAVENQGAATAIFAKLTKHFSSLYTGATHEKTVSLLKRYGWVQSNGQLWRWAKDQAPTDLLDAPLPFIYDVQDDTISVGHPGARTSDIPGKFTPGGIVEGTYEPGGKVVVRSMTSMPYTVRHMIELWYYSHPHLEVKSVHLQDDAGKDTRLASTDIGSYVKQIAAMDPAVHVASNLLQAGGGEVYAVGGAVRDTLLGKEPDDIDLMVTGLPNERVAHLLQSLPGKVVQEGNDFPVFHYRHKGHEVHIALPRTERSTGPGHTDFEAHSDHRLSPEDDFARRDYTANAMGVNLKTGELVDPYGGAEDIRNGTLRTTTDKTLSEDPLRVLRGIGAHARHGLVPDETTRAQMRSNAPSLTHLPAERIHPELDKIMKSDNPAAGIRLAHETGVLKHVLPEVEAAFGFNQNNPHHEMELGDHLLSVLDRISEQTRDPDLRLAALLHDIGKPGSAWRDPETGSDHYYEHHRDDGTVLGADHDKLGAQLAHERMRALKYPTERIRRVSDLINHHMWPGFTTNRGARRFLQRVGDHADDLMTLRQADQGGKSAYPSAPALSLDTQRRLVDRVRNAGEATDKTQLVINGNDLINAGVQPGPIMGKILNYLTDQVVDNPQLNTPEALLPLAQQFARLSTDEDSIQAPEDLSPSPGGRQAHAVEEQGLSSSLAAPLPQAHTEVQQGASVRLADTAEPYFPSEREAIETNQEAYARWAELFGDDPTWGGVLKPNELSSALGAGQNHYAYGPEEDEGERLSQAAAKMGWRIAGNQVFTNGNKRTAYWMMREMLDRNGLGHLSPLDHDDTELADHLVGQDRYGENEWLEMWRNRYYQGQPTPGYQQQYPEGTYMINPEAAVQNPPAVPPEQRR